MDERRKDDFCRNYWPPPTQTPCAAVATIDSSDGYWFESSRHKHGHSKQEPMHERELRLPLTHSGPGL
jgi:hypothetical protein